MDIEWRGGESGESGGGRSDGSADAQNKVKLRGDTWKLCAVRIEVTAKQCKTAVEGWLEGRKLTSFVVSFEFTTITVSQQKFCLV